MSRRIYWHWRSRFPITLHLKRDHHFMWTSILGVKIGGWFIGAIQGREKDSGDPHGE